MSTLSFSNSLHLSESLKLSNTGEVLTTGDKSIDQVLSELINHPDTTTSCVASLINNYNIVIGELKSEIAARDDVLSRLKATFNTEMAGLENE